MGANIAISELLSTKISTNIGIRALSLTNSFADQLDSEGNIVDKVWNFFKKVTGFLWKAAVNLVKGIQISARAIAGWLQRKAEALWRFNWQATDEQLNQTIKQYNINIAAAWGGFVGRGIGWIAAIAIGAGISLFVPVIGGTALAGVVALSTSKEAVEDLAGELKSAVMATLGNLGNIAILKSYMYARKLIRGIAAKINWKNVPVLGEQFGKLIAEWGQRPNVSWSFESFVEEKVESINNEAMQAFVEEALEESWDAFIEGGYVVADTIDSQFDILKAQAGTEKKIVLYPDKENKDESIVLYGNSENIKNQAITTLGTARLLGNRDIGYFDIPDTDTPMVQPSRRELRLTFYTVEKPPFYKAKRHTIKIANPKDGITFNEIKRACNTLDTGIFYASARLTGHRGKMVVHGSSLDKAKANLEEIASLCDGQLGNITVGQKLPSAKASSIQTGKIYPAYAEIGVKRPSATGNVYADGDKYERFGGRLTLWYENSPIGSQSIYTWLIAQQVNDDP